MAQSTSKDERKKEFFIYSKDTVEVINEHGISLFKEYMEEHGDEITVIYVHESLIDTQFYKVYIYQNYSKRVLIVPGNGSKNIKWGELMVASSWAKDVRRKFYILKRERGRQLTQFSRYLRLHQDEISHLIMSTETVADIAHLAPYSVVQGHNHTYLGIPIAICDMERVGRIVPVYK